MPSIRLKSTLAAAAFGVVAAATSAAAHEELTLVGTVDAINADTIEVKTPQGGVFTITVSPVTKVRTAGKPLTLKDLKVGTPVSIAGYADQIDYMLALGIEVLPPTRPRG